MSSSRKVRLENQIRSIVSSILLYELQDPRMGFTTVTSVELSGDLRHAAVRVSILADEKERAVTMNAIRHARGYVQKLLGERLRVKYLPAISFEEDESVKRSVNLSRMLRQDDLLHQPPDGEGGRENGDEGGEKEEEI